MESAIGDDDGAAAAADVAAAVAAEMKRSVTVEAVDNTA